MAPLGEFGLLKKAARSVAFQSVGPIYLQPPNATVPNLLPWEQIHLSLTAYVTSLSIAFFIALSRAVR